MNHIGIMALLLLMTVGAGASTAQTKTDTTKVKSDSITWSKELDGVVVKAQKQLIKQEIDRIGYDVGTSELTVEDARRTDEEVIKECPWASTGTHFSFIIRIFASNFTNY